ncbi:hypothetical protein ACV1EX_18240 [Klebsiella pneumoniae]
MTDITELAQSLKAAADREMICRDVSETSEIWERTVTPENILALVEALEKTRQRIEELESDLSEWTDCKHDGATYYDMSGQERCGRCGADI